MRAPLFYSCYFVAPGDGFGETWRTMARVLEASARTHLPGWEIRVEELEHKPPRARTGLRPYFANNAEKLDRWCDVIAEQESGRRVALFDADTILVLTLDGVWEALGEADLAFTFREVGRYPFPINGGVVFARVSLATQAFFLAWRTENAVMLTSQFEHDRWKRKYGGMNQAALGALLETGLHEKLGVSYARLPCVEWNCEDSAWVHFDSERTRVLHLKSSLRNAIFAQGAVSPSVRKLVTIWRNAEVASR